MFVQQVEIHDTFLVNCVVISYVQAFQRGVAADYQIKKQIY